LHAPSACTLAGVESAGNSATATHRRSTVWRPSWRWRACSQRRMAPPASHDNRAGLGSDLGLTIRNLRFPSLGPRVPRKRKRRRLRPRSSELVWLALRLALSRKIFAGVTQCLLFIDLLEQTIWPRRMLWWLPASTNLPFGMLRPDGDGKPSQLSAILAQGRP
jgi:hypothetical protein